MGVEEKVKKFLKVIEEKNPELGAFLFVDKKGALARARTLDKKTKKG